MTDRIDAKRWLAAARASDWEQSQIQGFLYSERGQDVREGFHVIRDLRKDAGSQKVWERWGAADAYDEIHQAMMTEIELRQVQIICDFYRHGWPEPPECVAPDAAE